MAVIFVILVNVLTIYFDLGAPLLNLILAVPVGYQLNKDLLDKQRQRVNKALVMAFSISSSSLIMMLFRWLPLLGLLKDPLLYGPDFVYPIFPFDLQASLVVWMIMVVIIFPILQLFLLAVGGILAILYK